MDSRARDILTATRERNRILDRIEDKADAWIYEGQKMEQSMFERPIYKGMYMCGRDLLNLVESLRRNDG